MLGKRYKRKTHFGTAIADTASKMTDCVWALDNEYYSEPNEQDRAYWLRRVRRYWRLMQKQYAHIELEVAKPPKQKDKWAHRK
jgi:hypothetical protein